MRTGTGILTRDDVNVIVNDDIWVNETTRCLTVASLASLKDHLSAHNISYTLDSAYSGSSYRLIPYDKISFTTTPTGPITYKFNVFGDTTSTSAMNSFTFNGALVIQQGSSAPTQTFNINSNIYKTGTSVDLSYQGSTISESTFNSLYFFITGGWTPNYNCICKIFKTKGTSFNDASYNKTSTPIYQTDATKNVSTQSNPYRLSSIGTYDEFRQGILGIYILLERSDTGGAPLTISPTSWSPTKSASSKTFTANNLSGNLSVFSKPTWATVNISGSSVTVSITTNTTTSIRSGTVTLSGYGTDGSVYRPTISISQAASSIGPSISPTTKTVTADAQTINVTISNVRSISYASSTNTSIAYPVPAASNVFNRQISISANASTSVRGATVTYTVIDLDGATKSVTVTITQNGKTSTAQPTIRLSDETEWTEDTTASISGYTVYKSNTIGDKSWTILTLEVEGYANLSPLDIYIRSYAERNYDYAVAYELDYVIEPSTYNDIADTDSRAVANTRTNQQSGTGLASYTKVSYTIPDNNRHQICVVYRKDINGKSGDDAAYVAIPNEYLA